MEGLEGKKGRGKLFNYIITSKTKKKYLKNKMDIYIYL